MNLPYVTVEVTLAFYRPERDWRKADAAVIDAINAVLESKRH